MFNILLLSLVLLRSAVLAQLTASAQNATAFALVYGYPLLAFQTLADRFLEYNVSNLLYHVRDLSTADNRTVVKPNVDTLYSALLYDVSQANLALQTPDIPDGQFAVFSFYDPYGDNYVNFGSGAFQRSGTYLLQRPSNASFETGLVPRNNATFASQFVADVYSPSAYGILLIRWLVNSTNLDSVHQLQDQTTISLENRTTSGNIPNLTSLNTPAIVSKGKPAEKVLNLLATYGRWNLPSNRNSAVLVAEQLESAGISGNQYTVPEGIDLEAANRSALASVSAAATNSSNLVVLNNGWNIPRPGVAGSFENGTNFAYRAAVAASGYLMLQASIAIYPSWTNTSNPGQVSDDGSFDLAADEAWLYTFSRKPPLRPTGFWSMTVYADNYLVPNELNRYGVGDRSNLTFPDGSSLYGPNDSGRDEPFQVLVQAADHPPPKNWTNNWIPGPAGGGSISTWLRFYLAQDGLLNGTYDYPVVERRAAITGDGNGSNGSPTPTSSGGLMGTSSSAMPSPTVFHSSTTGTRDLLPDFSHLTFVAIWGVLWVVVCGV